MNSNENEPVRAEKTEDSTPITDLLGDLVAAEALPLHTVFVERQYAVLQTNWNNNNKKMKKNKKTRVSKRARY